MVPSPAAARTHTRVCNSSISSQAPAEAVSQQLNANPSFDWSVQSQTQLKGLGDILRRAAKPLPG